MHIHEEVVEHQTDGDMTHRVERDGVVPSMAQNQQIAVEQVTRVVWYVLGVIGALLVLRILFQLAGAQQVGFAGVVHALTDPLLAPFRGILVSPQLGSSHLDSAAVLALLIYYLIGWGVVSLIRLQRRPVATA